MEINWKDKKHFVVAANPEVQAISSVFESRQQCRKWERQGEGGENIFAQPAKPSWLILNSNGSAFKVNLCETSEKCSLEGLSH